MAGRTRACWVEVPSQTFGVVGSGMVLVASVTGSMLGQGAESYFLFEGLVKLSVKLPGSISLLVTGLLSFFFF